MNLETKITIYKFTPQFFTLTRNNPIGSVNKKISNACAYQVNT